MSAIVVRSAAVLEGDADDRRREKQKRLGENDRHDARVIDLERHVLRLAAVDLPADDPLGVLDGDLAQAWVTAMTAAMTMNKNATIRTRIGGLTWLAPVLPRNECLPACIRPRAGAPRYRP